ncbi:MAG: CocE/NonD family hydrolase [Thiobacillus sp.]
MPLAMLLVGLTLSGCQSLVSSFVLPKEGIRVSEYPVSRDHDAVMTTSDGVNLVANIYRPAAAGKFPTILVRIPFTQTWKNNLTADVIGHFWASRGYNVAIQGTRGRYKSGGTFYPLRNERQDGIETLHWLSQQSWFDGRLGMWGGSAFGHTEWVLADQESPGPSVLLIQIASTNFYGMFHPGGAFSLESALFWAARSHGSADVDPSFDDLERGFNSFPLIEADNRAVGEIPFFNDWALHTDKDDYWQSVDGEQRARTLKAPVLLMAGWSDPFLPTQLRDFEDIQQYAAPKVAKGSRLIIGPWTHADPIRFPDGSEGGSYRVASLEPTIAWFDHTLRGDPLEPRWQTPVRLFIQGENTWRDEQEWPLKRTVFTPYYLRSQGHANTAAGDGKLSASPPDKPEPADQYRYDPLSPTPTRGGAMLGPRAGMHQQNGVEERSDVLVYSTDPLQTDREVTGQIKAGLFVNTSAPSTDFTVKLVDVYPDGQAYNVSDGILRRHYTDAERQNTQATRIEIEIWPTSYLFRKGHRIRVEISSSNFPRYDRNPNTGRTIATEISPVSADQTVFHAPGTASYVLLPVIPR